MRVSELVALIVIFDGPDANADVGAVHRFGPRTLRDAAS
jgi:hypothetical protein